MLSDLIYSIENGAFPPADMSVDVVAAPSPRASVVASFTAHTVVAADVDECWVHDRIPAGDLSAPMNPPFLHGLEDHLNLRINSIDMVTLASPLPGPPPLDLVRVADSSHPRVQRATRYRDEVAVWTTSGGVLVLGRGLAGRWEAAIEVDEAARGNGLGRALATAARHLGPADRPLWAQIAPGNATSVRAFLAAGYQPIGSEALLV
jgi:GNAT superfamily N-acetyltransferase